MAHRVEEFDASCCCGECPTDCSGCTTPTQAVVSSPNPTFATFFGSASITIALTRTGCRWDGTYSGGFFSIVVEIICYTPTLQWELNVIVAGGVCNVLIPAGACPPTGTYSGFPAGCTTLGPITVTLS